MDSFDIRIAGYIVHIYTTEDEDRQFLFESKQRGVPLGGPYTGQRHTAHTSPGQHHLHIFLRNNQLFALNRDGTAHDQSQGVRIPNRVAKGIATHFPDFTLPSGNVIEAADIVTEAKFFLEWEDQ